MNQRDGFTGGFLAGTVIGGIVGGIIGAVVASRLNESNDEDNQSFLASGKGERFSSEESIEMARHRLEDKIAQLNHAIDDVRQQLDPVDPGDQRSVEQETTSE